MCKTFLHYILVPVALPDGSSPANGFTYSADAETCAVAVMNPGPLDLQTSPGSSFHPLFLNIPCAGHKSLAIGAFSQIFRGYNAFDMTHPLVLAVLSADSAPPRVTFGGAVSGETVAPVYVPPVAVPVFPSGNAKAVPPSYPPVSSQPKRLPSTAAPAALVASSYVGPISPSYTGLVLASANQQDLAVFGIPNSGGFGASADARQALKEYFVGSTFGDIVAAGYDLRAYIFGDVIDFNTAPVLA